MPSERDVNPVDRKKGQEPPRPTESRPPSDHPGSKGSKAAQKGSGRVPGDKENEAQAGAEAENAEGKSVFRSLFGKMTAGLSGGQNTKGPNKPLSDTTQKAEKESATHEKPSSKSSGLPGGKKDKHDTPKDGATDALAAEGQQASHQASGAKHEGNDAPKRRKKDERESEAGTLTEKGEGNPPKKAERAHRRRDEQPADDQQGIEASHASDIPSKPRAMEGRHKKEARTESPIDGSTRKLDADQRQADTQSHASEQKSDKIDKSRKLEKKKHAKDRLHDVTKMFKGDSESKNSGDDSEKKDKGVDPVQSSVPTDLKDRETVKKKGRGHASGRPRKDKRKPDAEEIRPEDSATRIAAHNTHPDKYDTAPRSVDSDVQYEDFEYAEAKCAKCGDWIYVDPKTGKLCDPQPTPDPEICDTCGQPWPKGKPYSDAIVNKIKERLESSKYKDVLCKRCAAEEAQHKYVDDGVQVDERELADADDGYYRGDHFCKKTDFERDENNVEPESFPDDPDRPTGNKRALLIGINYSAQKHELRGCRNDVKNMYFYLKSNGYKDEDIDILMDVKGFKPPIRQNIVNHMHMLVEDAKAGDSLFFHYSGHGGQTMDLNHDESDGKDEGIYPVDYQRWKSEHNHTGMLIDDDMHKILARVHKGVHMTVLFDSCHSGSALDLPYALTKEGVAKVDPRKSKDDEISGRVILWSGCKDSKTSADTKIDGTSVGAMSHAFIAANWELLQEKKGHKKSSAHDKPAAIDYTYDELLAKIRRILNEKFSQTPQLSSSQPLDPGTHKVYI